MVNGGPVLAIGGDDCTQIHEKNNSPLLCYKLVTGDLGLRLVAEHWQYCKCTVTDKSAYFSAVVKVPMIEVVG